MFLLGEGNREGYIRVILTLGEQFQEWFMFSDYLKRYNILPQYLPFLRILFEEEYMIEVLFGLRSYYLLDKWSIKIRCYRTRNDMGQR